MGLAFLGIGTTRSGTTFLHEQLRAHPGVWLPPQKELHYFDHQRRQGRRSSRYRRHLRSLGPDLWRALHGQRGPVGELAWQLRYHLGPRSDAWLQSLYEAPAGLVAGQIEPTYARLPLETIRLVHGLFPGARLVYLMRDPIDRAWSSVVQSTAQRRRRPMARVGEAAILEKLRRSAVAMSTYVDHLERWESIYPREQLCFGFTEELVERPAGLLDRVCRFIGAPPGTLVRRPESLRPVNHTRGWKVDIPPRIERYLAERLVEPTRALEQRFGGYTSRWLERMERVLGVG